MKAAPTILVRPFGLWQLCQNKCRIWLYLIWEPRRYTDNTNGWYGRWKGRNCILFYCLRLAIHFKIKTPNPKFLLTIKPPNTKFLGENAILTKNIYQIIFDKWTQLRQIIDSNLCFCQNIKVVSFSQPSMAYYFMSVSWVHNFVIVYIKYDLRFTYFNQHWIKDPTLEISFYNISS